MFVAKRLKMKKNRKTCDFSTLFYNIDFVNMLKFINLSAFLRSGLFLHLLFSFYYGIKLNCVSSVNYKLGSRGVSCVSGEIVDRIGYVRANSNVTNGGIT